MSTTSPGARPGVLPPGAGAEQVNRRAARKWAAVREERLFLFLAIVIGVIAGLAVVCFRVVIGWLQLYLLGSPLTPLAHRLPLVPALVGLVIGALLVLVFSGARGSGVNQTKAALYIYDGYIPFRTVVGKFITSALAIGSGQSLGPEDPSIQMGAGLASLVGRKLKLSRARMRLLAPLGAAAGLAAAFNAPIAAILFVIEEVIGQWSMSILSAVVLSAVAGTVVERWFLGAHSLFTVPPFELRNPVELAAYAGLGVVGGFASLAFVKAVIWLRPKLKAMPRWTQYFQPAIGGLLVGIIAIWYPQVLGAGYIIINQALHAQFLWTTLAILAVMKILATLFSFTSGTPGGMFAPTRIELAPQFAEVERARERFDCTYLPEDVELLFKEALTCFSGGAHNAFASMCRRTAQALFSDLGEAGKLKLFDALNEVRDLTALAPDTFAKIRSVLFGIASDPRPGIPLLHSHEAGVLLEVMKDLLYQTYVRRGRLEQAMRVRRFFYEEAHNPPRVSSLPNAG